VSGSEAWEALRTTLGSHDSGVIAQASDVAAQVSAIFPVRSFEGGMTPNKVRADRMEEVTWDPPLLTFAIERHGAIVGGGSTRAEIQVWTVDTEREDVSLTATRRRQVRPAAPTLKIQPLVDEWLRLIDSEADDERVHWSPDRRTVSYIVNAWLPGAGVFRETLAGRRKRFGVAVDAAMTERGWTKGGMHSYTRR